MNMKLQGILKQVLLESNKELQLRRRTNAIRELFDSFMDNTYLPVDDGFQSFLFNFISNWPDAFHGSYHLFQGSDLEASDVLVYVLEHYADKIIQSFYFRGGSLEDESED